MTDPRSDDLQRRIDAMAVRIGVRDKIETNRRLSEEAQAFLMRARAGAAASVARERRNVELLARCIVDEFERRSFRADWLS
ncbi:hypothetical protein Brsp07_00401 [Brucella sp. NBRC 14130]|uniref:hypothetical protein n=1 Tax=Brucella TaxID=234 RepID=UPI00159C1733|nr:hypothetical protein [Brucella intermedia]NVM42760.1 hypothetical protein [Brucella intermedia]UXO85474.1 hypothetical protein N8I72_13960 [Brucella intermedia]